MNVHLTPISANVKTGRIPVSISSKSTCPVDCEMRDACYAGSGPLALHWQKVTTGERGMPWADFCQSVANMPDGQLWRMNQAGDLPGDGHTINPVLLGQLVKANQGRRGFTYSHYRDQASIDWIRHCNQWGFTVNLSANSLDDADTLADHQAGPVVCIVPSDTNQNTVTPKGRKVTICPATIRDNVSCETCQLCQRQRETIIGFPAHGTRKRVIDIKLQKDTQ